MAESFDGDWLDLREPFDAAARDAGLAARLAAALPARPRILDLGAGTGSLLRWLGHFMGRAQAWTLVDADAGLIERAFDTIAERAADVGWGVTFPGKRTLLVHSPHGAWRVEGLVADLREAPDNLPLHAVDAVVNTALCDLVSEAWVERMAAACAARRLPFYAALNVTGRERFWPPHPGDALVARGFARDQRRDKGFGGVALGAKAPATIGAAFAAQGYEVLRAPSDWVILRRDWRMALELAEGHAAAARAQERRLEGRIARWAVDRATQARDLRLSARVGHADLLCLPGNPA
ncbi:class I SAM-dependent methyltransferase [Falsiroseomonas oryziterrae]|uniref:class I SAM-dependent methyltransferase n=1 Tax=Falsiroseomonas oryziterrae TaxID=2911368 RepID=UPI001F20CEC1|nr:class I SAM-dependent methyltransferase [Roseomonas sp. NPKOSM-4]